MTVNESGLIQVDFKGDGTSTTSQSVTAAGQYPFTSSDLSNGSFTAKVTFMPTSGAAASASVSYTIDTTAPALVPASSTAQGPLYSRTLTFSENINAATIGVSSIAISGPGITGSIQPASVIGSGSSYVVTFFSPLTKGGEYTLALSSTIADIAGNTLGSGVSDEFQLTPDTTRPAVSVVSPSGVTSANVSSLSVSFNKAINPSTFTSSEVAISGPAGAIATSSITITEVDAADYTVAFPTQTLEGTYNISIGGPGVLDISENAMTAAYQTSFTISFTTSLPDLVTSSVHPSVGSATFGATLSLGWTVTNNGTASASGPWVDNIYLSTTPRLGQGRSISAHTAPKAPACLLPAAAIRVSPRYRSRSTHHWPRARITSWSSPTPAAL